MKGSPDNRIRVLYLNNAPFIGGAQFNIKNSIRVMNRQEFEPIVVIPNDRLGVAGFFEEVGVRVVGIPMRSVFPLRATLPIDLLRSIGALAHLVRQWRIDVIHSHMQRAGALVPMVKWLTGVKFVWHLCDGATAGSVKLLTRFADRCTCVSRAVYEQYNGRARGQFQLIYTGVWTEDLSEEQLRIRRAEVRNELGIPPDVLVLGSVANFQYWKGIHVVIRALVEVVRAFPKCLFLHLGGRVSQYEGYEQSIYDLVRDLGVQGNVRFLGFRKDALRYYPGFDLFVHAPVFEDGCTEAFGHSIVEAMASRLAVVASRCGGPKEIVKEGVTGALVTPGDSEGLAKAIISLLANAGQRGTMGRAGYERYKRFFTQEREVREYERLYAELVRGSVRFCMPEAPVAVSSEMIE